MGLAKPKDPFLFFYGKNKAIRKAFQAMLQKLRPKVVFRKQAMNISSWDILLRIAGPPTLPCNVVFVFVFQ